MHNRDFLEDSFLILFFIIHPTGVYPEFRHRSFTVWRHFQGEIEVLGTEFRILALVFLSRF